MCSCQTLVARFRNAISVMAWTLAVELNISARENIHIAYEHVVLVSGMLRPDSTRCAVAGKCSTSTEGLHMDGMHVAPVRALLDGM